MTINWRRGFWRVWVVASTLWLTTMSLVMRPDQLLITLLREPAGTQELSAERVIGKEPLTPEQQRAIVSARTRMEQQKSGGSGRSPYTGPVLAEPPQRADGQWIVEAQEPQDLLAPEYFVTTPDGEKYRVTAPQGATEAEVIAHVRTESEGPWLKYRDAAKPDPALQRARAWMGLRDFAALGFGVPLIFLALGAAGRWTLRGFMAAGH
jgi:hypothetical protein